MRRPATTTTSAEEGRVEARRGSVQEGSGGIVHEATSGRGGDGLLCGVEAVVTAAAAAAAAATAAAADVAVRVVRVEGFFEHRVPPQ